MDYIPPHLRQEPQPEPRWLQILEDVAGGIVALSMASLLGLFLVTHLGCADDSAPGPVETVAVQTSTDQNPDTSTSGDTEVHTVTGAASLDSSEAGSGSGSLSLGVDDTSTSTDADTSTSSNTSTTSSGGEEISTSTGEDTADVESSTGHSYQPAVCYLSPCTNNTQCAYGAVFENMCFGLKPSMCTHPCDFDEDCAIQCEPGDYANPPGTPSVPAMRCDDSWCKPYSCSGPQDQNCDCREWWPGTFYCH